MSSGNWQNLLPNHESILKMSAEKLQATEKASDRYLSVLAHGISGIGNLLACTASNGETGLSETAVTDIGWMLESLGTLISNLSDTGAAAAHRRNEITPEA